MRVFWHIAHVLLHGRKTATAIRNPASRVGTSPVRTNISHLNMVIRIEIRIDLNMIIISSWFLWLNLVVESVAPLVAMEGSLRRLHAAW